MNVLAEPFAFEFFRQGLLAATLVGALCGMIGVYVILRRMSYIGHGLSHSVFGGAVVAYVASINFYVGAGLGASCRRSSSTPPRGAARSAQTRQLAS